MNRPDQRFERWFSQAFNQDLCDVEDMWDEYDHTYKSYRYNIEICWMAWCASHFFR